MIAHRRPPLAGVYLKYGWVNGTPVIRKSADLSVELNLREYAAACKAFSWDRAQEWIDGLPGGGSTSRTKQSTGTWFMAVVIMWRCDVWAIDADRHHIRRVGPAGTRSRMLCGPGDRARAARLQPGGPGACAVRGDPRHTQKQAAFSRRCSVRSGPSRSGQRVVIGSGVAMVTSAALYRKKVAPVRDEMPTLQHILLVDEPGDDVSDIPGRST